MRLEIILYYIAQEWFYYAVSVLICSVLCYLFFRKRVISLLDPFFFRVIGVVFANAIPLFMYFCGIVRTEYFIVFVFVELSFWMGFSINKRKPFLSGVRSTPVDFKLFVVSFLIIVLFRLFFYINYGLPLLSENRSDKYVGGAAGLGVLDRLTYIIEFFCAIYSFSHIKSKSNKKRALSVLYLFLFLLFCFFEGSKSAVLLLVGPIFFYYYYIKKAKVKMRNILIFFFFVLSGSILVIMIQGDGNALIDLIRRFMMFGDVYYEAYGYDTIKEVVVKHPISDLLVNVLAPFRIMDYNIGIDVAPSIQVHRVNYPELEDINGGPNNRAPFLYYCLFGGLGAAIVAFFTGWFSSMVMYKSIKYCKKTLLGISIYASLYNIGIQFCTDPILALSYIPSFIFGMVFLYFILLFLKR